MEVKRLKVAVLIESSRVYGRGLMKGISDYAKWHGPWSLYWSERRMDDPMPSWMDDWQGDGIIARVTTPEFYNTLKKFDVPIVDVLGRHFFDDLPMIDTDDKAVAELAAQHLIGKGFKQLAYCGIDGSRFSDVRLKYFEQYVTAANLICHHYEGAFEFRSDDSIHEREEYGLIYKEQLAEWIVNLPKPIGLFVCNDVVGQYIINICRENNVLVPEQVSVMGVDNDELICDLSLPTLSSVEPDTKTIGHNAAKLLDALMNKGKVQETKTFVAPLKIVQRQSTDIMAVDDFEVCQALKIIREHACEGINVSDVVSKMSISRRSLERRFEKHVKHSLNKEITRVQIEKVKELLVETHYGLSQISKMAGFDHPEYMQVVFKKYVKHSPGKYRESMSQYKTNPYS